MEAMIKTSCPSLFLTPSHQSIYSDSKDIQSSLALSSQKKCRIVLCRNYSRPVISTTEPEPETSCPSLFLRPSHQSIYSRSKDIQSSLALSRQKRRRIVLRCNHLRPVITATEPEPETSCPSLFLTPSHQSIYSGSKDIQSSLALSSQKKCRIVLCRNYSRPVITTSTEPEPVVTSVLSYAPATVAKLGPGFSVLGAAIDGYGDFVTVRVDPKVCRGKISISEISSPHASPELSKDPFSNPAGIAAIVVMKKLGVRSVGLSLSVERNLPPNIGLGSDASSAAAAAAVAVNELFDKKLPLEDLVVAGHESVSMFSDYRADNIAPALMGGFVLVRNYEPLDLKKLSFPASKDLFFVLVMPRLEVPEKRMREVLPTEIGLAHCLWNCSQAGALVAAVLEGDVKGLGKAMSNDKIIEPRQALLIPGMAAVKQAAIDAGAFGCAISGSGPAMVAVVEDERVGKKVGMRMVEAFWKEGNLKAVAVVTRLDRLGARPVARVPRRWW